jgi:hypothetical protein
MNYFFGENWARLESLLPTVKLLIKQEIHFQQKTVLLALTENLENFDV